MKLFRITMILAIVLAAFGMTQTASATLYTYKSTLQIYNMEGDTANIVLVFYNQDGSQAASVSDTIPANDDKTYTTLAVPDGFDGSMVVSSDNQITAISNIRGTLGAVISDASYVAASVGSTSVQLPLLQKNNGAYLWNSWFNVQNVGSAPATVNVAYSDGTSAPAQTIAPGAAFRYDQSTEAHTPKVFAAVVSSGQPLAVTVVNEHGNGISAYSGFAGTSVYPVMPLVNYQPATNRGWTTGVQIMNTGGSSTNVTVAFTPVPGSGTACTETQTIAAGQSKTFALTAFASTVAGEDCVDGALFVGAGKVTVNSASMPLAVIVNQNRNKKVPASYFVGAYGGFDPAIASRTVIFPLIMSRNGAGLISTAFNIMNAGTSSTTVTCTFTGAPETATSPLLAPGDVWNQGQTFFFATWPYVGSAICTASGGDMKIIGVANEQATNTAAPYPNQDRFLVYEGTNAP